MQQSGCARYGTAAGVHRYRYIVRHLFVSAVARTDAGASSMTHVVTENCIKCKFTDCVDVCPVDCFREGANFLVIDPDECIDCAVCVPECPANAIFAEEDVPQDQVHFIELNAELTPEFESITRTKKPLPEADDWNGVADKLQYLER